MIRVLALSLLVCLAGWLCLLDIPDRYHNRIKNIHPALLPSFATSCWPCIRKSSTHSKKFWRLESNEFRRTRIPERTYA